MHATECNATIFSGTGVDILVQFVTENSIKMPLKKNLK